MADEKLLKVRATLKKRKPTYRRVQAHQFAKLNHETKWRKPKGMGNKVRRGRRGKPSMPEVGFSSPKSIRGLNKNGLREVIIGNTSDLVKLNAKEDIAVIGRTVGGRKKIEILAKAKELKVSVAGHKDVDASVKSLTKVKKAAPKKAVASTPKKETKKTETKETKKSETSSERAKK